MNSKILNRVTVTGADDSVDVKDLIEMQREFPYAEFGILLSRKYTLYDGTRRFPSARWLDQLVSVATDEKLHLSGHVCGRWVERALEGNWFELNVVVPGLTPLLERYQLNTHGEPHAVNMLEFGKYVLTYLERQGKSVIFQLDGTNSGNLGAFHKLGHKNISGLFDLSHGAGILPDNWLALPEDAPYCGYAGGLSPDNVLEQMPKIEAACGGRPTWIDAETHLRSDKHDGFDLEKVYKFLGAVKDYVI